MPFDGVRTAVAAGGGTLNCYGLANSVECYMDGAFLKVDWLIMDLDYVLKYNRRGATSR